MTNFYSRHQYAKFKRIKKFYKIEYNMPDWKAEQYAYDHIILEQRKVSAL